MDRTHGRPLVARRFIGVALLASTAGLPAVSASGDDVRALIVRVQSVGREGAGNESATAAIRELSRREPAALVEILQAMDDERLLAANWLRGAVDAICERTLQSGGNLPAAELESFVYDRSRAGVARRLAFEWLTRVDAAAPDRIIPGMLTDPALELRRDAVIRELERSKRLLDSGDKAAARAAYEATFAAARDRDQVELIAKQLEPLGQTVDFCTHYGLIREWQLIGPFDNTDRKGFVRAYPPENELKLDAAYPGKAATLKWTAHRTAEPWGVVDLNKVIGKHMGVVAYAAASFDSPREQRVCIRVGSPNAVKIWLNGSQIFEREEYHHGMSLDQHATTGILRTGQNHVVVKVCQNEQTEEWAQSWMFQCRVCDFTGGAILGATAAPPVSETSRGRD